jgi:hypothetical protein
VAGQLGEVEQVAPDVERADRMHRRNFWQRRLIPRRNYRFVLYSRVRPES